MAFLSEHQYVMKILKGKWGVAEESSFRCAWGGAWSKGLPRDVNGQKTNEKRKYGGEDSKSLDHYLRMHCHPRNSARCCISNSTKTSKVAKGTSLTTSTKKLMGGHFFFSAFGRASPPPTLGSGSTSRYPLGCMVRC